jgi:tetratricopeptide (TPR) repeat protein
MQKKYGHDKGFVLVALSDEPADKVKSFTKKEKLNYIVGADAKSTFKEFGINGYPTVFVVDPGGKIIYKGHDAHAAEEAVEKSLKEKPPKVKGGLGLAAGSSALAKADKLYESGEYAKALKEYEKLAKANKKSDVGKKARAKADKIKADKEIMAGINEAEAKKNCENWLEMARTLVKSDKDNEAAKYYKRIIDEYPETSYAETAKRELAKLES